MFQTLTDGLDNAFKSLRGDGKLTELNIAEAIKEIRRSLVAADVNYKIAKEFTDKVKDEAMGTKNVLSSVKPGDLMVKIVQDQMIDLMGGQAAGINIKGTPGVILIAGLQGSGKTTFSAKLANFLKTKRKNKPLLVACDVYRPAAMDHFYLMYSIILIPFFIVNGILTGMWISEEVVWYNDEENLGFRLMIIPVEDVFYGMAMLLMTTIISDKLKAKGIGQRG